MVFVNAIHIFRVIYLFVRQLFTKKNVGVGKNRTCTEVEMKLSTLIVLTAIQLRQPMALLWQAERLITC